MSGPTVSFLRAEHVETPIERIRRLEQEARTAALAEAEDVTRQLHELVGRCAELAEVESLPTGRREVFRSIGLGIDSGLQSAQAVAIRSSGQ